MQPAFERPLFTTSSSQASTLAADVIAVPMAEGQLDGMEWLDRATAGELSAAIERGEFRGKPCELWSSWVHDTAWRTRWVAVVGLGSQALTPELARRVGAAVGLSARQHKRGRIAFALPAAWDDDFVEALAAGATESNYDAGHYKSRHDGRFFLSAVEVARADPAGMATAVERGAQCGDAVNSARLLINEPGNGLTPRDFVSRGQAMLSLPHVTTEVLDEAAMQAHGMGLLLGVARGSAEPPRLLVARYEPVDAAPSPVLGLIGKGVTFDTGGLSLKPADGMERMKDDMAGGAAVIAAMRVIALEQLPIRVIAVVPATENMPGGRAVKPGDILRGASGLTVEVNNTDAEGRLILGDALWYAQQLGATHLVDVATLTGACIVALGKISTGLFATEGWVDVVRHAAARAGERLWPMPLAEEYRESLKSEIADMINSPGRPAGAITAAMFLKEFVGDHPWAHLDIAGPAWADEGKPWVAKGATGVMVRTLVELARTAGRDWPQFPPRGCFAHGMMREARDAERQPRSALYADHHRGHPGAGR